MQNLDLSTIIFAIVAIFVVVKLRSVLGTRNGAERPPQNRAPSSRAPGDFRSPPAGANVIPLGAAARGAARPEGAAPSPDRWQGFAQAGTPLAIGLDAIAAVDPDFAPDRFLAGGRGAYEMIVSAFAAADIGTLRRLLAPDVFANFDKAIRARLAAGQTLTTTLVSLDRADIVDARLTGSLASVAVRFAAKIASVTHDAAGEVVDGAANEVAEHLDVWTFTRDANSRDPNWLLTATQTVH